MFRHEEQVHCLDTSECGLLLLETPWLCQEDLGCTCVDIEKGHFWLGSLQHQENKDNAPRSLRENLVANYVTNRFNSPSPLPVMIMSST